MEPLPANPPEEAFVAVLDVLREDRRTRAADPDRDRPFLAQLDALYNVLDEAATERVDALWWRGWPDLYDAQTRTPISAPTEADLRATIVQMIQLVDATAELANPRAYAIARGERVDPPVHAGDSGALAIHRASRRDGLQMRALAAKVGIMVPDVLGDRGASTSGMPKGPLPPSSERL